MTQLLEFNRVSKLYGSGDAQVTALDRASFAITEGSLAAIYGPSGSGKSTVLNLLGLLDRPTSGHYTIRGVDTQTIRSDAHRAKLRRETFGFIFQQFNLLPKLSALDNVMLPAVYARRKDRTSRAIELLTKVGLGDRLRHRPNQLSGGQQQRVAIARALMNEPQILLADEPTGNLDRKTGAAILKLLQELHRNGHTVVIVTHDPAIATIAEQEILVLDGRVSAKRKVQSLKPSSKPKARQRHAI